MARAGSGWLCPWRGERQAGLEPGYWDLGASSGRAPMQGLRENTLKLVRDTGTEKPAAQLRPLSCISGSQYVSLKART